MLSQLLHLRQYSFRFWRVSGSLTDHYDPRNNVIRLSDSVYHQTSTAAIGVAAHEAGHAIQYAQNYAPIRLRNAIIPVTNLGSKLAMPLILIGLLFAGSGSSMGTLAYVGVACFGLSTLFQLFTLPTEFDASRRAIRAIETCGILTSDEIYGSKKCAYRSGFDLCGRSCGFTHAAIPAADHCKQAKQSFIKQLKPCPHMSFSCLIYF